MYTFQLQRLRVKFLLVNFGSFIDSNWVNLLQVRLTKNEIGRVQPGKLRAMKLVVCSRENANKMYTFLLAKQNKWSN